MKLISNYHTHTKRCGHALDEDEDYVLGAIELGITDLGFSDHVPLKGLHFPGTRQDYEMLDDYVDSLTALRKKYSGMLDLHIGFEAEYIPEYLPQYRDMLENRGIEYLICGQHCYIKNGDQVWYNARKHDRDSVTAYVNAVIAAMRSGLFTYIAHPDHFMNGYREWDGFAESESRRLLEEAEKCGMPLEINVAGLRFAEFKHRKNGDGAPIENLYPYPAFWDIASEYDIKGIVGIDAHRKHDFLDGIEREAVEFAAAHNIPLIEKLDIG